MPNWRKAASGRSPQLQQRFKAKHFSQAIASAEAPSPRAPRQLTIP